MLKSRFDKQKIFNLLKWVVNIIAIINLVLLLFQVPFYQKKIKAFDDLANKCKNGNQTKEQLDACTIYAAESSKYVDTLKNYATYGIILPILFYGFIFLFKDFKSALKEK